ncbi:cupin domain-containing protein [Natronorarus salvus]|uniref:cupin domain-containing protein n=1 Tax=Natronorarus salvus TaxID=3117733 RepID=UPI002F26005A
MGYSVVDPEEVDPFEGDGRTFRHLARYVGFEEFGLNHVRSEPGGRIPLRYHSHDRQEEAFFVLSGTFHVETPDEEFVVGEGRAFFVEPGHPHRTFVPESADESVKVLTVGAPSVDDVRSYDPSGG